MQLTSVEVEDSCFLRGARKQCEIEADRPERDASREFHAYLTDVPSNSRYKLHISDHMCGFTWRPSVSSESRPPEPVSPGIGLSNFVSSCVVLVYPPPERRGEKASPVVLACVIGAVVSEVQDFEEF